MEVKFSRYDTADYLKTEDDIAAYIDAVMEEGGNDPAYVARALGAVARARNLRGPDKTLPGCRAEANSHERWRP
ncbi:XRE family transcriptional regulator [Achromobacter sp. DMS1]|uniref:helix-turn-helix domain-containing transcriptional regulator n=1 Tax=Achromobacter sp. DMS1 TaxID=1688405 RepID=UPI00069ED1A8|nr:XRE family transcriptional regulator [Achromobacter sp. DMS1]KOF54482.1 XRE family transcriptional regulator [Achromobacter sp. DMS1]